MTTVKEAVEGLTWMAGHTFLHGTVGEPDALQVEVLQRIQDLALDAGRLGSLERVPSPEAALRELLKGKSEYSRPDIPVALAPYNLERISLPSSLHDLPEAKDLLPVDARRFLLGEELMLRDGEIVDTPKPYWDPVLANNKHHYRSFIQKLDSIGLLQDTQKPKNQVGAFFPKAPAKGFSLSTAAYFIFLNLFLLLDLPHSLFLTLFLLLHLPHSLFLTLFILLHLPYFIFFTNFLLLHPHNIII